MKQLLILLFLAAAVVSCKQSDHMEDHQPYEASETGPNTSDEVTSGGVKTSPEATSDTTAQDTAKTVAPLNERNEVTPSDISKPHSNTAKQ